MSTSTQQTDVRPTDLWFSLATGPVLWAGYHALVYALASLACQKGFWLAPAAGPFSTLTLALLGLTLLLLAVLAFGGYRAYNIWRRLRNNDRSEGFQPDDTRAGFMAFGGIVLNLLFGVAILLTFLPSLFFDPCS